MNLAKSFFLSFCLYFSVLVPTHAQNLPVPTSYVSDFAQVLSSQFEQDLNQNLSDFEVSTGNQIVVATVKSLEGLTVEEFSINLAESWGIGQADKDNGILFLFAPNDKKVRIEVGYGLEHLLTDGQSGYILDTEFIPEYRQDNYEQAILNTVTAIKSELIDPSQTEPSATTSSSDFASFFPIIIILFVYLLSYFSRSKEFTTGGIVGFIGGLLLNGFFSALFLGLFGLILDFILSKNYKNARSRGLPTGFRSTFGGFKSSGRSGGFGGGGGGGFSGGGGGFGGGGSSRSL